MLKIFKNTENGKTNDPDRFRLSLADKRNLKNPNKNMALANISIYYTWKNIKSAYNYNKFKFQLHLGIMNLICLIDLILLRTSKNTLNLSLKNMKL